MRTVDVRPAKASGIDRAVAFCREQPRIALAWVLGLHVLIWTALPILVCRNLQLDLVEGLALGKEWQLGYWKHPPLPWWMLDATYRVFGDLRSIFLLGAVASAVAMYFVWRMALEVTDPLRALISAIALEGIHFFNFTAVKFNHDVLQLPFWALAGWFTHRGITRSRVRDWMLAGAFLGFAFWTKYTVVILGGAIGLFLLVDPAARRAWRTPGPYAMAAAFLIVIAPHVWWLIDTNFMSFQHVEARAVVASKWHHYVTFPLRWIGSQLLFTLPAFALVAVLYTHREKSKSAPEAAVAFNRRYVTALALGPFVLTTVIALVLGRLPVAMWGYPMWCFAPLAVLLWLGPINTTDMRPFARGFVAVFVGFPIAYAAIELFEPMLRDRPKATQFPGQALAQTITKAWHDKYGTPLVYAAGTEFAVNNLAVYSPSRPHVVVHGRPLLSPWIDMSEVKRRGAVLVWEEGHASAHIEEWRNTFPGMEVQPVLELPRQALFPVRPARIVYALVPPRD